MTELNMEKIHKRIKKTISMEEALKDVVPMNWSDEVLSGQRQVVVTNMEVVNNSDIPIIAITENL